MAKRPTDEQLGRDLEGLKNLLNEIPGKRGERIKKLMDGPVGDSFVTAPASSREEFHSCFPGGLLHHSLNVYKNLVNLVESTCAGEFPKETLIIAGLFHDLGKAGDGDSEFYVPQTSEWHKSKGMLYEFNKDCLQMPTSERGLYILQKNGIPLTSDEYLAIRLNDGQYVEENKWYRLKEPKLALLVHWADRLSLEQEKAS